MTSNLRNSFLISNVLQHLWGKNKSRIIIDTKCTECHDVSVESNVATIEESP